MSKILIALLLSVPFATPVAAGRYLRMINAGATPIIAIEATPAGTMVWGQLSLADRPLYSGMQLGVALSSSLRCRLDLRVIYADGQQLLTRGFNLCQCPRMPSVTSTAGEA